VAQYVTYQFNDTVGFALRGEVFADQKGTFVCSGIGNLDYADAQRGLAPNLAYCTPGNLTYGEITLGANYKPSVSDMGYLTIRPEVRWDTVVGGGRGKPYDASATALGTKSSQYTLAIDAILGF